MHQALKTEADFWKLMHLISYPGFQYIIRHDGNYYLQIDCAGKCNVTGKDLSWSGRKWRLSLHMTDSEVVQTAFMATMAALEHEARELFTYRGVSVYDPHYDVEKLVKLRRSHDALSEREEVHA